MAKPQRAIQIPGEDLPQSKAGTTELNNITGKTANDVGGERETVLRARAAADAANRGVAADIAPGAAIGAASQEGPSVLKRRAMVNGVEVDVETTVRKANPHVQRFGPESRLPSGTPVRKDGTPCEGDEQPYGIIGDIILPEGRLVNRVIPVADSA
jgi:hypothetical protein